VVVAIVIVVAGGGTAAWAMTRGSSSSASTQLVAAKRTTIQNTVSASGTIEPAHQAGLNFAVTGRVTRVFVKVGDVVKKGDRLARIDATSLKATAAAARATVSADEDKVAEDSSGTAQYSADAAALTAARASEKTANAAVTDATLRATIDGTVTTVDLTTGESVSASGTGNVSDASSSSSTDQVDLQSAKSFLGNATVDDTEVSQVKKGQAAAITPDGATFPVTGTVSSVSTVPSSSSGVVSFPIVVTVTGDPTGVYSGASATVAITTEKVPNVLEIPTLAITYSGSKATVQISANGHTSTRTITAGTSYGLETQVLSGINVGEKVVVRIPTFGRGGGTGGGGEGGTFFRNFGGTGRTGTTGTTGTTGGFGNPGGFGGGFPGAGSGG
jgi:membrane fusion protein, macrolide-specific efflux system